MRNVFTVGVYTSSQSAFSRPKALTVIYSELFSGEAQISLACDRGCAFLWFQVYYEVSMSFGTSFSSPVPFPNYAISITRSMNPGPSGYQLPGTGPLLGIFGGGANREKGLQGEKEN